MNDKLKQIEQGLHSCYENFTKAEYIDPDPLMCALSFSNSRDREVAAFISALYALGRVDLILPYLRELFGKLNAPADMLINMSPEDISELLPSRPYRFFSRERSLALLVSIGALLRTYGSLEAAAARGGSWDHSQLQDEHGALYALDNLGSSLRSALPAVFPAKSDAQLKELMPGIIVPFVNTQKAGSGGAAKRLMLFLRWMVRRDAVDPGGWELLKPAQLLYPLDTHMMNISAELQIRSRKSADMGTVFQITEAFRHIAPEDPVKFDFCLTRFGIHPALSKQGLSIRFE